MNSIKKTLSDKGSRYALTIILVYAAWKVFHYLVHLPGTDLSLLWSKIIHAQGVFYAGITSSVLNAFGERTWHRDICIIYEASTRTIKVEEHCLAIPAMVIFTASILLFSGPFRHKVWFILLGLFGIFLINTTRLAFVCIAFEYYSDVFFRIHHSFIYVVATYGLIMLMIMWWMKKFSASETSVV